MFVCVCVPLIRPDCQSNNETVFLLAIFTITLARAPPCLCAYVLVMHVCIQIITHVCVCVCVFCCVPGPQMMEKHFKKKQVPFDDLHEPFRSPDIPVVIFSVN